MSRVQVVLLLGILLIGLGLRTYNIAWDSGTLPHPDERSTVAYYAPTIRWPKDLSTALDPRRSTLNPFWDVNNGQRRSYTYGHFPLYTLVLTASAAEKLAPVAESLHLPQSLVQTMAEAQTIDGYAYIGRFLVALADTFSIFLVFLLGRRLYGAWAGLLAAAFSAFTVLQIQLAHFFAVDPVSTTFTLLALYGAILMYDRGRPGAAVLTGVGIGLAVSSKYSALPIVAAPLVAAVLSVKHMPPQEREAGIRLAFRNLVIAGLVSFVVFALTSPFVLLDFQNFWQAVVKEQGDMVSGVADLPFTRQYRGTLAYWYFIVQQLRWGMGWPLGLLAFAGLAWVLLRALWRSLGAGEWIVLSWVVLYFGPTGLFLAKFMRYMVPVVPLFVLFGAGLVARSKSEPFGQSSDQPALPSPPSRLARYASYVKIAVAIVALLGAIIWSLAFVNGVYGTPHTWVTASLWAYQNIPDGSCIAVEHWEEGFPRSLDQPGMNPGAHNYRQPLLPMYEEDTRQKFETLRDTLQNCDYIALASNRLWRTIPKLPERYPMSTRYYQALFDGELGFEQIYTLTTPPRLGPLVIDDQSADESFTVYDHPRPIIFKKVRQLSDAEWESLLGDKWQTAVPGYVGPPTLLMRLRGWHGPGFSSPNANIDPQNSSPAKSLLLDRPVDELPVVDDYHWNLLANRSPPVAILVWWLAVQLIGWLAWPLAQRILRRLPTRGYLLSKSLGWLLVGYAVWLGASLHVLQNRLVTIIGALLVLAVLAAWFIRKDRHEMRDFLAGHVRLIVIGEVLFTLVYLYFVGLRLLNPDLWQPWNGGEKMLEIGFLNAIVKSANMPPYDPFFAGGYINYYYYGLFLVGVLVKLTGIQPTIAFNLAVPMVAGLTAAGVFSLGYNLAYRSSSQRSRAFTVGALAVLLVVFVGNLAGFTQLVNMLSQHGGSGFESSIPGLQTAVRALAGLKSVLMDGTKLAPYNYWDPSRVIPDTINEFPYWSFLFADLHPHMIGIPFTVLFLSLAYARLRPASGVRLKSQAGRYESPALVDTAHSLGAAVYPDTGIVFPPPEGAMRRFAAEVLDSLQDFSVGSILRWLVLPFCLGALAVINTWDLPTYLGVITLVFWLTRYGRLSQSATRTGPLDGMRLLVSIIEAALFGGLTLAASYLLYRPFFTHYQPLDVGLGLVHDKTNLGQFIKIWGLPLFIAISYLVLRLLYPASRLGILRSLSLFLRRWNVAPHLLDVHGVLVRRTGFGHWMALWSLAGVVGLAIGFWVLGYRVPALLLPLVWLAFLLLLRPDTDEGETFAGLLLFTGLLLLLGVEFFFLRDFLGGGAYYRMNTLFKFYIQAWVMLGVTAAFLLPSVYSLLWARSSDWVHGAARARWTAVNLAWQGAVTLLMIAVLTYPLLGTPSRVRDRFDYSPPVGTLDGMAYMTVGTLVWPQGNPINLEYDYEAIRWLQANVKGTPVVAEAKLGYYREGGMRVSAYTGLPMPLGGLHQSEQRWPDEVGQRDGLYTEFWNTSDTERAWELIRELNISYVYLGQLELSLYNPNLSALVGQWSLNPNGIYKFDQLVAQGRLAVAYQNEHTRIYRVVDR